YNWQQDSYMYVLYREFKKFKQKPVYVVQDVLKKYVFIIDEINRGEISKIFGELFFSIDPGYRGEKGRVQTQYQNMIENDDVFKKGFYVPENVYIIGTMNDIDRSVESMDFAMRRRFAWQEVTAEESYYNMIENAEDKEEYTSFKDEIKQRMFNLNKAIAETEGLNEAYQIGAAYFRKVLDYINEEQPFECLWNNHLKGLLFEYLRGNRKAKELLEKLYKAYNMTVADE
ncbi:MAG: AAA family ATPase, partial [Prevotella sp.]|nr:AAA family ATPase [Prevotella sp.]